jgi:Domain of unknown function (DUF1707)/Cell wall-active antibiotics response 4TMS YvqF
MPPDGRSENRLTLAAARDARERVIAALQEHFAHDALDVDEFERRVTLAHTSEVAADIDALIADLPTLALAAPPAPQRALVPAADVRPSQATFALMSSTRRAGPWTVPRRMSVRGIMSSTVLDFREARFPPGVVDVEIRAVMSSVEIIVPPGLAVETHGSAVMGTFDEVERAPAHPDPEAPLLRVHGLALMSAVEIRMQLPGESGGDAWRRKRRELRDARREQRRLERADRHRP